MRVNFNNLLERSNSVRIVLPWPPTANTYWRHVKKNGPRNSVLLSEDGRLYRELVRAAVLRCGRRMVKGRYAVRAEASPPDRRRRDLDNLWKGLLDALTHAGIYDDDSLIDDLRITRRSVVDGGSMLVTIDLIEAKYETPDRSAVEVPA